MKRTLSLLSGLLLSALAGAGIAQAADEIVIRAGHGTQTAHPSHLGLVKFQELVAAKTNGKVKVQIYPDRQLGEEREMVEGLQLGSVDMAVISTGPLLAFAPQIGVIDLPFLFKDSAHVYKVLDGEVGKSLLAKLEPKGIVGLAWWENGWRHLTTNKPVASPDDLKGMKLRTMQNPVHIAAFKELGASPIPMAWGEVFTSLGQKVIDAQENPITIIYTNSLWEVQKNVTLTGHVYGPHVVMFSKMKWDTLPADAKTAIQQAAAESTTYQREQSARLEAEQMEKLRAHGMTVSKVDTTAFRNATAKVAETAKNIDPAMLAAIRDAGK
ncbi:DctP family TRAP transporter solute-binding subunit [Azospirillum sp. RWY-5-1]|uniref:DctP family TRAP transporter solute-binding subunit n=1 Tax=Azospirillum oleiclasticum TaxID=2735135 RepID=A0ABX2TM16_9PROT|nr:TRAP transporter substrate-binding protein [Azospirillum oleiclasticum]NYZ17075.1 DctP family TRAP transporter solute-binding subunit [Azospirillum oleiclasticum]NYZ24213.1 DctP family TRAP transporter solute-binding subunit [Azospirillum oleiclasticum]